MKPTMLFAIVMLTAIVVASSFGLQIAPVDPINVSSDMAASVLYVCPATQSAWTGFATAFRPFRRYVTIFYFFGMMMLMFSWGWALYQNLLKDKFDKKAFKTPWGLTKFIFWSGVIILIAAQTPNHFRSVNIRGADGAWVMCESNTPGARAVRSSALY